MCTRAVTHAFEAVTHQWIGRTLSYVSSCEEKGQVVKQVCIVGWQKPCLWASEAWGLQWWSGVWGIGWDISLVQTLYKPQHVSDPEKSFSCTNKAPIQAAINHAHCTPAFYLEFSSVLKTHVNISLSHTGWANYVQLTVDPAFLYLTAVICTQQAYCFHAVDNICLWNIKRNATWKRDLTYKAISHSCTYHEVYI